MLGELLTQDKKVFEYWGHALAVLPIEAFPHCVRMMKRYQAGPRGWFAPVTPELKRRALALVRHRGPIAMEDIDEARVAREHLWASGKPTKLALEYLFFSGRVTIHSRDGIKKRYELTERHFGWRKLPGPSSANEELNYRLDRALGAQGWVSLESATHLDASARPKMRELLAKRVRAGELEEFEIDGLLELPAGRGFGRAERVFYAPAGGLDAHVGEPSARARVLSPFDPLVIQRKRLAQVFGFGYTIECYLPANKRKFGYFCLPVLVGDEVVGRIDVKADRAARKLRIQALHWEKGRKSPEAKRLLEEELSRFQSLHF